MTDAAIDALMRALAADKARTAPGMSYRTVEHMVRTTKAVVDLFPYFQNTLAVRDEDLPVLLYAASVMASPLVVQRRGQSRSAAEREFAADRLRDNQPFCIAVCEALGMARKAVQPVTAPLPRALRDVSYAVVLDEQWTPDALASSIMSDAVRMRSEIVPVTLIGFAERMTGVRLVPGMTPVGFCWKCREHLDHRVFNSGALEDMYAKRKLRFTADTVDTLTDSFQELSGDWGPDSVLTQDDIGDLRMFYGRDPDADDPRSGPDDEELNRMTEARGPGDGPQP